MQRISFRDTKLYGKLKDLITNMHCLYIAC